MADAKKKSSTSVTLEMVKDLLQVQENSFNSHLKLLMNDFNSRLDAITREMHEMKVSLEYSQKDIDEIKGKTRDIDALNEMFSKLRKQIEELENKLDYLENQNRRNNIRISGIKEDRGESWDITEKKVKDMFQDKLGLDSNSIVIERAHRTGKPRNGKPKQIVAKLLSYKDKEKVIKSSKKLKGTGIFIKEDFSARVLQRRSEQYEELKKAREEGKIAYFNVDRLVIKDHYAARRPSSSPPAFLDASVNYFGPKNTASR